MKHDDQHDVVGPHKDAAKAKPAHDPSNDAAHAIAIKASGDPKRLAELLLGMPAAQSAAVLAAAQQMYGNSMTMAAMEILAGMTGSATGGHQRTDGTHGLEGNKSLFDPDSHGAKHAQAPKLIGAAQRGRYGGTFGASRFGDGEGMIDGGSNHKFGKGRTSAGFEDHSHDAGMFANTSLPGDAGTSTAPIPYPSTSGAPGGLLDVPTKERVGTTVPMTNGDNAGTASGVGSAKLGPTKDAESEAPPGRHSTPSQVRVTSLASTPRDDQDAGGGTPVVLSRADAHGVGSQLDRQIGGHHQAGGSNDGRGDTGNVAGDNAGGGMIATKRETVGGRGEEIEHGGSLDYDAVLKINALVNPGRT